MEHLDENALLAFFEKRLDRDATREVDEHLAGCAACRRLVAEFAAMAPPANPTAPLGELGDAENPSVHEGLRVDLGRRIARGVAEKRVGSVLCNKWRIDRLLEIGGMAQVYEATHRNGRRVAVKVLKPELSTEPAFVERFLREGYVANKVEHPGAVAILDDDMTAEGAPFLVMELLEGRTLRQRVAAEGPLPLEDALRVAAEVLDVLAAAHDRGIIHRDVKPDNLFEARDGTIKVLDFGIARLRESATGGKADTQTGATMGTIGYMPPEQARGLSSNIDARSDVWAVGATLFTLLTGRALHEAATTNEGLLLSMTAAVQPMRALAPQLPQAVQDLLDTALAFDKISRFPDARAMAAKIAEVRGVKVSARLRTASSSRLETAPRTVYGTLLGPGREETLLGVSSERHVPGAAASAPRSLRVLFKPGLGRSFLLGFVAVGAVGGTLAGALGLFRGEPTPDPPSGVPRARPAPTPAGPPVLADEEVEGGPIEAGAVPVEDLPVAPEVDPPSDSRRSPGARPTPRAPAPRQPFPSRVPAPGPVAPSAAQDPLGPRH